MGKESNSLLRILYLVTFGIIICYLAIGVAPKVKEIAQLSRKIKADKMAVKHLSKAEIEKQKRIVQKELIKVQEGVSYVYQLTNDLRQKANQLKNIAHITLEIEDIATDSAIELKSVKPIVTSNKEQYKTQVIEIGFEGEYFQLIDLLSAVENSPLFMGVQQLTINNRLLDSELLDVQLRLFVLFTVLDENNETLGPQTP